MYIAEKVAAMATFLFFRTFAVVDFISLVIIYFVSLFRVVCPRCAY